VVGEQRQLIAELEITCNVDGATVKLNDKQVGHAPFTAEVVGGRVLVWAESPGYVPVRKPVNALGGQSQPIALTLEKTDKPLAHVRLASPLPGADIYLDGVLVGVTPLSSTIAVAAGEPHRLEVRRAAYYTATETIPALPPGGSTELVLSPKEDPAQIDATGARLVVRLAQADATVRIDGERRDVTAATLLAPGLHAVRVERGGYDGVERLVELSPHETVEAVFDLVPLEETRVELVDAAVTQRTVGWTLLTGGAVIAGLGVAGVIWGSDQRSIWTDEESRRDGFEGEYAVCGPSMSSSVFEYCRDTRNNIGANLDKAKALQAGGAVVLGVGAATLIAGTITLIVSDDPDAFRLHIGDELAEVTLTPSPFGVSGTF
jgi:hypothetical protein